MRAPAKIDAMVCALTRELAGSLAQARLEQGWPIWVTERRGEAIRQAWRWRPSVVVVQLAPRPRLLASLRLLHGLHMSLAHLPLVAVEPVDREAPELAARQAGATCYLPAAASAAELSGLVAALRALRLPPVPGAIVPRSPNARDAAARPAGPGQPSHLANTTGER